MQLLDAFRAAWILFLFLLVFFFFPSYLFLDRQDSPTVLEVAGNFVRALLIVTTASFLLASLKVLNATTVVALLLGTVVIAWAGKRARASGGWLTGLKDAVIGAVRLIEGPAAFRPTPASVSLGRAKGRWLRALQGREWLVAILAAVLVISGVLEFAHPVRELRLEQPEQYQVLLRARELMLNRSAHERPLIFPSVIAVTSFVSGADAMQVTRFLCPTLEILVFLAAGLLIRACTRGAVAAIGTIYCLGTAALQPAANDVSVPVSNVEKIESVFRMSLTRIRANPEFEIGLLCLLLAVVFLADWHEHSRGLGSLLNAACCLFLVALVSQFLLLVCVTVTGAVLLWRVMGAVVLALMSYGLAAYATLSGNLGILSQVRLTLPLAAALGVGCFLACIEAGLIAAVGKTAVGLLLVACVATAILWCPPHALANQYLEYEKAARETQIIADGFPRQTWAVVAPTEELAETFGLGGYEDLAEFVEKYQERASVSTFHISDAPQDLFVYVEKKPFQFFQREPEIVPLGALVDTTYRSYRSPAGRASLESAALRLCESYRQSHDDADIFFEDEDLRIYRFHRQPTPDTAGG